MFTFRKSYKGLVLIIPSNEHSKIGAESFCEELFFIYPKHGLLLKQNAQTNEWLQLLRLIMVSLATLTALFSLVSTVLERERSE